jgi:hypothetical protein
MPTKPSIQPGEWIKIGKQGLLKAVVCIVYPPGEYEDCEVVYLDESNHPVNSEVRWTGSYWELVQESDLGGYADRYDRLKPFVQLLRGSATAKVQRKQTKTRQRRKSRR